MTARDDLLALLAEARPVVAVAVMLMFVEHPHRAICMYCHADGESYLKVKHSDGCAARLRRDVLARIDAALGEGEQDGE